MQIHHVGYLVHDMAASVQAFIALGYELFQKTMRDEAREIDIAFCVTEILS